MLEAAGTGVVMGNADEAVKARADVFVTAITLPIKYRQIYFYYTTRYSQAVIETPPARKAIAAKADIQLIPAHGLFAPTAFRRLSRWTHRRYRHNGLPLCPQYVGGYWSAAAAVY